MPSPTTFDAELIDDWNLWVIDNGLPPLPSNVNPGEAVPVASWTAKNWAAVVHLEIDASGNPGKVEAVIVSEVSVFRKREALWDLVTTHGANWFSPVLPLFRAPTDKVIVLGKFLSADSDGSVCRGIYGVAGVGISYIQLRHHNSMERSPIVSPLGAFVVLEVGQAAAEIVFTDDVGVEVYSEYLSSPE